MSASKFHRESAMAWPSTVRSLPGEWRLGRAQHSVWARSCSRHLAATAGFQPTPCRTRSL
jgi:hypothetical protein